MVETFTQMDDIIEEEGPIMMNQQIYREE